MKISTKDLAPLKDHQKRMLLWRGMDPKNYLVIKDTYASLYLLDLRYGKVKIITKLN
jgi:hypothetical protein